MATNDQQNKLLNIIEINNEEVANVRNSILLNAHFIEKEMVMNKVDVPNPKFMDAIAESTKYLLENAPEYDRFAVLTGITLLNKYDREHKYELTEKISQDDLDASSFIKTGRKENSKKIKKSRANIKFLEERSSHRLFEQRILSKEEILSIISTASNAPTACNRQPCKIIYGLTKEENDVLRNIVPDGFVRTNIPNFFAIICDASYFNKGEELQDYVNGGIFLQNLLLAIEAHGYGATAFQTPVLAGINENNKKALGLSETEFILATIGYGIPIKKSLTAAAQKRPAEYMSRRVKNEN